MICCDSCEEWFHGKCVGITMERGRIMEKQGKEYVCDKCKGNTAMFDHRNVLLFLHCTENTVLQGLIVFIGL